MQARAAGEYVGVVDAAMALSSEMPRAQNSVVDAEEFQIPHIRLMSSLQIPTLCMLPFAASAFGKAGGPQRQRHSKKTAKQGSPLHTLIQSICCTTIGQAHERSPTFRQSTVGQEAPSVVTMPCAARREYHDMQETSPATHTSISCRISTLD